MSDSGRTRIAATIVGAFLLVVAGWGMMLIWHPDPAYPEVPFRGFIALTTAMAAAVSLGVVLLPQQRTSPRNRFGVVAISLGVFVILNLVVGLLQLPSVGGVALIAVGVVGLLLGLPTLTLLCPRSYDS